MKKLLLAIALCCSFAVGYGVVAEAYPAAGMYGRAEYRGYFTNALDSDGTFVLPKLYSSGTAALDPAVNNATELINFLRGSRGLGGNAQQRTGAAFIIQTMIGSSRTRPPTAAQIAEWEARVRYAESNGRIDWYIPYAFCINTFYQGPTGGGGANDDAFFDDCQTDTSVVFRNASGTIIYAIKRECANPVGNVAPIPNDVPPVDFTMTGRTTVSDTTVEPGQTFTFRHFVQNMGPTGTAPTQIWWAGFNSLTGAVTGGPASSGTYTAGQEKPVQVENVTVPLSAVPFTQICRQVGYDPINESGASDGRGLAVCATVIPVFDLRPVITVLVNGAPPAAGSVAEPGDAIQFQYAVVNDGLTPSTSVNCTVYRRTFTGYHAAPTPPESTAGWTGSAAGTGCPRVFPGGGTNTPLFPEAITLGAGDANRSICRILEINPATYTGGPRSVESCVQVGTKPYLRVYDGDVSAGNGWPAACTNSSSTIVGWNKESPTFTGAGTQFAAYAIGQIRDFATAYGNTAGATAGASLAFANTTTSGASVFGGSFGSLPCIADYYARRATTVTEPLTSTNINSLSGVKSYTATGPIALTGGNINPGQQTVIYVDGDVLLTGSITYSGSWDTGNIPLFQLVVRGNIFISQNVAQLDGVYIAQPTSPAATNGNIYTCANTAAPFTAVATTSPTLYTQCDNKLTVNGAFIARQVQFLRTLGTLGLSAANEGSGSTNIAEVFNFSPAAWIQQPPVPTDMLKGYDAITSLPPVL